jgi:hypothetical protein
MSSSSVIGISWLIDIPKTGPPHGLFHGAKTQIRDRQHGATVTKHGRDRINVTLQSDRRNPTGVISPRSSPRYCIFIVTPYPHVTAPKCPCNRIGNVMALTAVCGRRFGDHR